MTVFNCVDLSANFVYGCPVDTPCELAPLTSLIVNLTNVPFGAPLSCESDVFVEFIMTPNAPVFTAGGVFFTVNVVFDDLVHGVPSPNTPCLNPFTQGAICSGAIFQGEVIQELAQTSEPLSLVLLGAGLIGLFGFSRKRWMAASSS